MQILSHRGYWKSSQEKNSETAFIRSFEMGFGTETDIRDLNGKLVISHDPPVNTSLPLSEFFAIYKQYGYGLTLALNIKADGLQELLQRAITEFSVNKYFVFDMSIPDTLIYMRRNMPFFTRESEYEPVVPLWEPAQGVWMDCFESDWISERQVQQHLGAGKKVCIVSPDLHGRSHIDFWNSMRNWNCAEKSLCQNRLMLCTDHPEEAQEHFDG